MQDSLTEHFAQAIKCGVLAAAAGFGYLWIMANRTSDEWRLGGIALGILALLFALATLISVLSLTVGLIAAGFAGGINHVMSAFRFHAFRKFAAFMIGLIIAVTGFAFVAAYDPKWGLVPVVIGTLVMKLPSAWAFLREQPWYYRIFRGGRQPDAEFAQYYHLRKAATPFRSGYRTVGGYCSNDLFIGTSTPETT